jgi:hypothetical protein
MNPSLYMIFICRRSPVQFPVTDTPAPIHEISGSSLGLDIGYPDIFPVIFLSPTRLCLKLSHDRFFPHPFQFIIHWPSVQSTIFSEPLSASFSNTQINMNKYAAINEKAFRVTSEQQNPRKSHENEDFLLSVLRLRHKWKLSNDKGHIQ